MYGKITNRRWYYPGYILDLPSAFYYKLELGKMEYYAPSMIWLSYEKFEPKTTNAHKIRINTQRISKKLLTLDIPHRIWIYPYFSMGHVGPWNSNLLRYPVIIELGHDIHGMIIIAYSADENAYSVLRILPCPDGPQFLKMEASTEFNESDKYLNHLYQVGNSIVEFGSLESVLELAKKLTIKKDFLPFK